MYCDAVLYYSVALAVVVLLHCIVYCDDVLYYGVSAAVVVLLQCIVKTILAGIICSKGELLLSIKQYFCLNDFFFWN